MHLIKDSQENKIYFIDKNDELVLLPTLFANSTLNTGQVLYVVNKKNQNTKKIESFFDWSSITERTAYQMLDRLREFLNWLEYESGIEGLTVLSHHRVSDKVLNYYINNIIIEQNERPLASAESSMNALIRYYNYLLFTGLNDSYRDIFIKPKNTEIARSRTNKRTCVSYYTPTLRKELYTFAKSEFSLRDSIVLQCGGVLGLRSKENRGFVMEDFRLGDKTYSGMKSLFNKLKKSNQKEFDFYLQGRFSKAKPHKGGKSRWLKISRPLLEQMKQYYNQERPNSKINSLFLNESNSYGVTPFKNSSATEIFRQIRIKFIAKQSEGVLYQFCQPLESEHTYHLLRHSFATDLLWELTQGNTESITVSSAEYLEVAQRLGHSTEGKNATVTARTYIKNSVTRSRLITEENAHD